MIGHLRPARFIGYYTFPFRLLHYSVDAISRVASSPAPTWWKCRLRATSGRSIAWAFILNRYCVSLFPPLVVFLMVYGTPLIRRWMNQEFATHAAPYCR